MRLLMVEYRYILPFFALTLVLFPIFVLRHQAGPDAKPPTHPICL